MPLHELDPKRLHNDKIPKTPEKRRPPPPPPPSKPAPADSFEEESKGDPRLIDHVPFENCAHESFCDEFCVPSTNKGAKLKNVKRAQDEGEIKRADMEEFLETILTQKERRGFWQVCDLLWGMENQGMPMQEVVVLEFESISFVVECEEKKMLRISEKDLVSMLWPCLLADSDSPVVKKVGGTWVSWTGSDKATFRWEIRGPKKTKERDTEDQSAISLLQQKTKAFFKTRLTSPAKGKSPRKEMRESRMGSMDLLARCVPELKGNRKYGST